MKNTFNKNNVIRFIYISTLLFSVLVYLLASSTSLSIKNLPDSNLHTTPLITFSNDWDMVSSSGESEHISDLTGWQTYSNEPITVSKVLPDLTDSDCLFVEINYNYLKVFANDLCIYDYSKDSINLPGQMTGHFISQIPLNSSMSGQVLSIQIYQPYKFIGTGFSSIALGTGSAYITDYLYSHLELIVSLFLMIVTSFCLLAISLWQRHQEHEYNYQMFRALCLFLLFSAIWIFTDSTLPQLFWDNPLIICVISFFCFMALPVPLLSFVNMLCPDSSKSLMGVRFLLLLNIVVQGLLYTTGGFSFIQMLPVTHSLAALSVIVLLICLLKHYRKNTSPYARPLLLALVLLILSGVLSLARFYISPQVDNSSYFRYGFLIFIGIMVYICTRAMLAFLHDYTEHKILKKLAYTDILTGTESRLAFEEFIEEIHSYTEPTPITLYAFDLNNLKTTNDTYGHKAGDIILQASANCILKVFQNLGRVFRIGGDEFLVVIQTELEEAQELIDKLEEEIIKGNETCEYTFTISTGYAIHPEAHGNMIDILLQKADKEMYKNKTTFKNKLGV